MIYTLYFTDEAKNDLAGLKMILGQIIQISGFGEKVELTDIEKEIVLKISKSLKSGIVGCDILT